MGEGIECAICMSLLRGSDDCISLPCNLAPGALRRQDQSDLRHAESSPSGVKTPDSPSKVGRPHVFHSSCLERWWAKSCQCPTCRRDVRQWLPTSLIAKKAPKRSPSINDPLTLGVGGFPVRRSLRPNSPLRYGLRFRRNV